MLSRAVIFHEYLSHRGLLDDIYKSINNPDLAELVTTVLNILRKTNQLPALVKESKSETKSTEFRNEGNTAYALKQYQKALMYYNKALLYAPKHSRAMKLAYSNRSALLHKIKAVSACLKDIETCVSMGCPMDIIEKLQKRKHEAKSLMWVENLAISAQHSVFPEEFFQFNVKCNPQIPCASMDVGVITENHVPKIVATTDIKVGTVLAVESAFVSQNDNSNTLFSCYYCHKMSLNLQPCDGCCFALFCDEECRENCLKMYHSSECKIIEALEPVVSGTTARLAVKAALKMRHMSKSWSELHTASHSMGVNRMKNSSINEIFDNNNKFSLLSVKDERHFLNGPLYNASFTSAAIINYLETIHGFFPLTQGDRNQAVRAMSRILMFLTLYSSNIQIISCVSVNEQEKTEFHDTANYGWFSFVGKLKNNCNPNALAVGLHRKIGLVACAPIKKGTELTISFVGHWLDTPYDKYIRNRNMFTLYGVVCNCPICTNTYQDCNNSKLTDMQKKNFRKLNLHEMGIRFNPSNIPDYFAKLCKTLAFLSDAPYSDEYRQVYEMFRRCVLYLQDLTTQNVILDYV